MMSPTAVSMLDAVRSFLGYFASVASVKSCANLMNSSVKTSLAGREDAELARTAGPALDHVEVLDRLAVLVHPLHRVGLQRELVLDRDAADEDAEARRSRGGPRRAAAGCRATRRAGRAGPRGSRGPSSASVYSRMPRIASGRMIEQRQITAMPTASSSPKSRIIGTLAKCSAANAKIASNVTTSSAGPRLRAVSWIGCVGAVDDHLLLDARVHLDRVVDADAEHHRQARDRDDRERDAEVAGEAERPDDADEDDEQREQAPAHREQHEQDHDHDQRRRCRRASACRRGGSR